MSSIVNIFLFFIKVSVPAPFRHRYRFKSIGYVPVSDKNQTIPIPTWDGQGSVCVTLVFWALVPRVQRPQPGPSTAPHFVAPPFIALIMTFWHRGSDCLHALQLLFVC